MPIADVSMLAKVVKSLGQPARATPAGAGSILTVAAASYAAPRGEDVTVPTGFDPQAAALFEAMVEAAFLVANADGTFDDAERETFERVVVEACGRMVGPDRLHALLADLADQLREDGLDARVAAVGRSITRPDHQREVLRIAALLAYVSGGVSDVERKVLDGLARGFGVSSDGVEEIVREVVRALF